MKSLLQKTATLALALAFSLPLSACTPATSAAPSKAASAALSAKSAATLKVGASPAPHGDILKVVKPLLAKEGIDLQIVEFTDYVQPNLALEDGSLDANYFQHKPYLDQFNAEKKTHIVPVAAVHFEPMGIYPGKTKSINEIKDGAVIGVPNDVTNEARALQLLAEQKLITLKEGVGLKATPKDILQNPKKLQFKELEAAQLPLALQDLDVAVINGNYAVNAGLQKTVLTTESKEGTGAKTYENLLCAKEGREKDAAISKLAAALRSPEVKTYIEKTWADRSVQPVF